MLRVSTMRDDERGRLRYSIVNGGEPALQEHLARVAGFGNRLLQESGLEGSYSTPEAGVLLLEVSPPSRTFFHEGVVFAALDAFNDPTRNVTITQPAVGDEPGGPRD
jgi:hypothetical protein